MQRDYTPRVTRSVGEGAVIWGIVGCGTIILSNPTEAGMIPAAIFAGLAGVPQRRWRMRLFVLVVYVLLALATGFLARRTHPISPFLTAAVFVFVGILAGFVRWLFTRHCNSQPDSVDKDTP